MDQIQWCVERHDTRIVSKSMRSLLHMILIVFILSLVIFGLVLKIWRDLGLVFLTQRKAQFSPLYTISPFLMED
jgi:hypothetical protein